MLMIIEKCPSCGSEICVDDAPGGLCPLCLMRRGLELANTIDLGAQSTPATSGPFSPPDPLELEADLPDFDVLGLLGQGGMGAVYKARHRGLDRIVAIKILPRHDSIDSELGERFHREARALARLKHENIVMAFDAGLTDRYSYFVMEYIDGPNLRQLLAAGELTPQRSFEIAHDVCEGLRYAHENGVVHRDIKPENVLIDPTGRAKIADFGLAKLRDPHATDVALTNTQHLMGTLHYMAPEQMESPQLADHRADIFALGVLTYEMLTGELPLAVFDPPSKKCAVDSCVDEIVLRALANDPSRRYQTAGEFSAAIAGLTSRGNRLVAVGEEPRRQAGGRRRVPRIVWIVGGFAAALLIAFWGWQFILKYEKDHDENVKLSVSATGDNKQDTAGQTRLNTARADDKYSANPAKSSPQPTASLIEVSGQADLSDQGPTEDLPIWLSNPIQRGANHDKTLTLDYQVQRKYVSKDRHYYLVIDGDHIGRSDMMISDGEFERNGRIRVRPMPDAGDGEPLRIYIEAMKGGFGGPRLRASNILKTMVRVPGAPTTDIRYPKNLPTPFAAIHWEGTGETSVPQVDIKGEWYELLAINGIAIIDIMKMAEFNHPGNSREEFEDRLPGLLEQIKGGQKPGATVTVKVLKLATNEEEFLHDLPFGEKPERK